MTGAGRGPGAHRGAKRPRGPGGRTARGPDGCAGARFGPPQAPVPPAAAAGSPFLRLSVPQTGAERWRINSDLGTTRRAFRAEYGEIWVPGGRPAGNRGISVTVVWNFVFPIAGTIPACNKLRCITGSRIVELLRGEKRYVDEIAQGSGPGWC